MQIPSLVRSTQRSALYTRNRGKIPVYLGRGPSEGLPTNFNVSSGVKGASCEGIPRVSKVD